MPKPIPALVLLALSLAAFSPRAVRAEEGTAAALVARIAELRKAEDVGGLTAAVGEVPAAYKAEANAGLRGKLRGELAKTLKDKDVEDARMAAVAAFVALEDPKPAWKELSRYLPDPKTEKATPLEFDIVRAAGTLVQSRAVKPLIELAYKAKDSGVATAAVAALGGYREDVKSRVKILEELVTVGKRTRPGQSTEKRVSPVAQARWNAMHPVLVKALNQLTGQDVNEFVDWEALWDEYKKRPKDIFTED